MTDPINVAKLDLESLTDFQRKIYEPKSQDEEIEARFAYNSKKSTWSTHLPIKLQCRQETDEIVYFPNMKFDYLLYTYLRIKLPTLKVKDIYKKNVQICWPHNVGLNIIKQGVLQSDGETCQTINDIWLNIHSQYFMKPGKCSHFNVMIGNVPFLEQWSTLLPEYILTVPQPWYYSNHYGYALPLFLCSGSTITHRYRYRLRFEEILRMRVFNANKQEWTEIPYNFKYLEGVSADEHIAIPELWGRHAEITVDERNWLLEENQKKKNSSIYIEDVVTYSSENTYHFGSTIPMDLHCQFPSKTLYWVAENMQATKNRNFSNFTTNAHSLFEGWNPCQYGKLLYGGVERIPESQHELFDRTEPWYHLQTIPREPGYNVISFAYDNIPQITDISVVMEEVKGKLVVKIGNTDPFLKKIAIKRIDELPESSADGEDIIPDELKVNKNEDLIDKQTSFKLHVCLLIIKKLKFANNKCHVSTSKKIKSQ